MHQRKAFLPLADADIVAYECAFAGQFFDKEKEELQVLPFRLVRDKIEQKVADIMDVLETTLEPIMYLTGEGNFRDAIAIRKGYKANRDDSNRPYHLANARAYIRARFNTVLSVGCEADDLLCVSQTKYNREFKEGKINIESVICTRDKDLRQCEGWHYGWEMGQQPEFKLQWVDHIGRLDATYKEGVTKAGNPSRKFDKLKGTGTKWLYAQILTGDTVDNIPGLKGCGVAKAFALIDPCETEEDMLDATIAEYKKVYEEQWKVELYEQAHLVYMVRNLDENNQLIFWRLPDGR